jgi:hypothetical protein
MKAVPETSQACLTNIPTEVLNSIFDYLQQPDLAALMAVTPTLSQIIATRLYHTPYFVSTYRFAQFAKTIVSHRDQASLVRVLDLSYFEPLPSLPNEAIPPLAGWRELQQIDRDIYYVYHDVDGVNWHAAPPHQYKKPSKGRKAMISFHGMRELERKRSKGVFAPQGSHPPPSPVLKNWARCRDIPVGTLCQVLKACTNLM